MSVSGNRQQRTPGASASSVDDIASQMSAREAKALYKEAARRDKERAEFEKRRNKKRRQRASTQNAIKYEAMDPDGICRIEPGLYSTALAASNVSYTALVENDQAAAFEAWCDFLNTMGSEVSLEIHVHNTLPDQEDVEDRLLYKMTGRPSDAYREDFNRLIADASQGNVLLNAPEIVYVFSVEAESKDAALVSTTAKRSDETVGSLTASSAWRGSPPVSGHTTYCCSTTPPWAGRRRRRTPLRPATSITSRAARPRPPCCRWKTSS